MAALGSLVVELALNYAQYTAALNKTEQMSLQAAQRVQQTMDSVKSTVGNFAVGIGAALAGAFSVAAMKEMITGVVATQFELKKLSDISGVSMEKFSGLAAIAKLSGTQADQLADSMNQLTQKMVETKKESDPAAAALSKIGISFKSFRDLTPDQQFLELAKSLDKFEDGAGKSAAIMAIMGEEGAKMLPLMKDLANAGEIQAKVTKEQVAQTEELRRSMLIAQASSDSLKTEFVNGMVPALNITSKAFTQVMNGTGGMREEARALAADGSLKSWTLTAAEALSYVADGAQLVMRGFTSVGKGIAGLLASSRAALEGNLSGSWQILKESGQDMIDAFKGETWGEKFREQLESLSRASASTAKEIEKPTLSAKDFVQAGDEGAKAAEKMAEAYKGLMASVGGKIAALEKEADLGRQLTESEKELVKLESDLRTGKLKLTDTMADSVRARIAEWTAAERSAAALKLEKEGLDAARESRAKYTADLETSAQTLIEGNKSLAQEIELIGANDKQRLNILKTRNLEIVAIKEAHAADLARAADASGTASRELLALQAEIEALRDRNGLLDTQYLAEGAAKAREAVNNEWKSLYDNVSSSLTDALMNGGMNAKEYLKGILRSLFVQPFVMNIVANLLGIVGGSAAGTAAQAAGFAGGTGGGLGGIGNMLSGANAFGLLGTFGAGMTAGTGGLLGTLGLSATGTTLGGAMSAGMIGIQSGNILGGLGTLVGALGPILAGISLLFGGDLFNSLFGRKLKDSGIEGKFGGETGFEGNTYRYYKGGLFRSNKTVREDLDEDTRSAWADQFFAMDESIRTMADTLGLGAEALDTFSYDFKISLKGLSDEEAMAKLQEVFGNAANAMAELVLKTDEYAKGDETRLETLQRLSASLIVVNEVFDGLGATLLDASLGSADWASKLIDAAGGMDKLISSASTYFDLYYSDDEKRARTTDVVNKGMEDKGLDLRVNEVDAKAKYRALVDQAIAEKDEALLAWLLDFADDFAAGVDVVTSELDAATQALQDKFEEMERIREETLSTLGLSMDGLVSGFINEVNEGRGAQAGSWLANEIAAGFEQAVYEQAVNTILSSIIDGLITPMITAALAGSSISDVVSAAAIDNMIANATAALDALNVLLNSEEFKEGMEKMKVTVKDFGNSIGAGVQPMSTYQRQVTNTGNAAASAGSKLDSAADALKRVADERESLEKKLLQLQGNTAELRRRELESIDPSNRALQQQIWLLEDAKDAQQSYNDALKDVEAAQKAIDKIRAEGTRNYLDAVSDYEDAQQRIADITRNAAIEVRNAGNSLLEWVRGATVGADVGAVQQSRMSGREYERLLSLAAGGDKDALSKLTGAADTYLQAAGAVNGSFDFAKIRGEVLRQIGALGAELAGTVIPGGDEPTEMEAALAALEAAEAAMNTARDVALAIGAPLEEQTQSLVDEYAKAVAELANANTYLAQQAALLNSINAGVWAQPGTSAAAAPVPVVTGGSTTAAQVPVVVQSDASLRAELAVTNARLSAAVSELQLIKKAAEGQWLDQQRATKATESMERNGVQVYNSKSEPVFMKEVT